MHTGARLHLAAALDGGPLGASRCGRAAVLLTAHRDEVTCARCRQFASVQRDIGWDEALRALAYLIAGPLCMVPALTPETWAQMECRKGRKGTPWAHLDAERPPGRLACHCPICDAERDGMRARMAWDSEQPNRPHRRHAHPFGSVSAALELLHRWRTDGPGARSAMGSLINRCEETARLGATVQTTQRHDRDDMLIRRADMAADIEAALRRVLRDEQLRRGLTAAQCEAVLLSTVARERVSAEQWAERTGLTPRAVRALIAQSRRRVTVELAAIGYVPEPRARDGLDVAIRKRRAEVR